MKQYLLSLLLAILLGTLAGVLIGFIVQEASRQQGWALVVGSLGASAGAFWAAWRRAAGKPVWRER